MLPPRALRMLLIALPAALLSGACGAPDDPTQELEEEPVDQVSSELVSYSCAEHTDTGYTSGKAFTITVVTVDGKPVEVETANAFLTMAKAAEASGITLHINSGFRTMAEQQYLYNCYLTGKCNNGNLAAKPGYSNHQSGHALDLSTGNGALNWLNNNAGKFGFKRTVPSENWHWEWWGGGSPQHFCGAVASCDRSAGGFTFSCDGAQSGMECANVNEPGDPDSWSDNHFCGPAGLGLKWSYAGPIAGMDCTNITEGSENHAAAWADNFLCLPPQSPYILTWSYAGPIAGQACVQWNEPADPHSWSDNHLCIAPRSAFTSGPFTFSGAGPVAGLTCESVNEPSDADTWSDNFLCSQGNFGLKWSYAGALDGMTCTNVTEGSEKQANLWADNFLCAPPQTPWTFSWSSAGPIAGKPCVRWYEAADLAETWGDNWLCYDPVHDFSAGGFTFSEDGPEDGKHCVNVNEPDDPDSWADNHFCSDTDIGLTWSSDGPVAGMRCTPVAESAEAQTAAWNNNHLCVPEDAPYLFTWSSAGPLEGKTCIRWFDHAETSTTWSDNWMCVEPAPPKPGGEGGGAGAAGAAAAGGSSAGAGPSAGGSAGSGGVAGSAWPGASGSSGSSASGKGGSAGKGAAGAAGTSSGGSGQLRQQLEGESESAGGCGVAPRGSGAGAALLSALAALATAARSRRARARLARPSTRACRPGAGRSSSRCRR